jgi:hypothetical protein
MAKKPKPEEQIPVTTSAPSGGARTRSLPSIFGKNEPEEAPKEIQGKSHRSSRDDTMLSLEDYDGVRELLHPGRNRYELDARTDVNIQQIVAFSQARVIAKRFGIKYLDDYVSSIERLSLSHKRKSRLEHVKALSGVMNQESQATGILGRLH